MGKVFEAAIDSSGDAARARRGMVPKKKGRDQIVPVSFNSFSDLQFIGSSFGLLLKSLFRCTLYVVLLGWL